MTTMIQQTSFPLRADADGTIRIGGTRVTLDVVVEAFVGGQSAEEIADGLETISLADVYATITYYLFHKEQVDEYLRQREGMAAKVVGKSNLREKLMARRIGGRG